MKVRLVKFFRFKHIQVQDSSKQSTVMVEIPNQHMICSFTLEEASNLYFALDEEYTRVLKHKSSVGTHCVNIAMPKVEELTRLTNMELLMGMDRGEGETEKVEEPVTVFKGDSNGGYVFASQEAISKFIESIEKYVQEKVEQEVAKKIGGLV